MFMVPLARRQRGLTLTELMVAITIGLLVTGIAGALFLQGSRAHAEDERYARMLENGRFALGLLENELRMSDYWGEMLSPTAITTALAAGEDCGIGLFTGGTALHYNNNHGPTTSATFTLTTACPAVTAGIQAGTDVLAFKRVAGAPTTGDKAPAGGPAYLRTNGTVGNFIDDNAPGVGVSDWAYQARLYYISNNQLCRLDNDTNGTQFQANATGGCLADGIQDLHIQFGIDSDGDGIGNRYLSNATLADLENAISARVYLLLRSSDHDPAYNDEKTYTLGDVTVGPFTGANSKYYRRVLSTTVSLRNPTALIILR